MLAPTYISSVALIVSNVLTMLGIEIGSESLTTTLNTLITIGAGLYIAYRQVKNGRSDIFGRAQ